LRGQAQRNAQLKQGWSRARQKALARKRVISRSKTYDGRPEGVICYRDFNHLALAASLAKVGVGGSNPLDLSK
jgi:hypothetical protein